MAWPRTGSNGAVKGFVPPGTDAHRRVVFESAHLRVAVAGAEHLLAMKVAAARVEQDRGDLTLLVHALGITTADQALEIARSCLGPGYPIPPRAMYLLEEIFQVTKPTAAPPQPAPLEEPAPHQTPRPSSPVSTEQVSRERRDRSSAGVVLAGGLANGPQSREAARRLAAP